MLWSSATVGGTPLRDWPGWKRSREATLAEEVRTAAYEIIRRKGATNHAIGLATAALLRWMLRAESRVATVARVQRDVAFSLPCVVGAGGAGAPLPAAMDAGEGERLERSVRVIRQAIAGALT